MGCGGSKPAAHSQSASPPPRQPNPYYGTTAPSASPNAPIAATAAAPATVGYIPPAYTGVFPSKWYWKEDKEHISKHRDTEVYNGTWVSYSGQVTNELEREFQAFLKGAPGIVSLDITNRIQSTGTEQKANNADTGTSFSIDFSEMRQTNAKTGFKRDVLRQDLNGGEDYSTSDVGNKPPPAPTPADQPPPPAAQEFAAEAVPETVQPPQEVSGGTANSIRPTPSVAVAEQYDVDRATGRQMIDAGVVTSPTAEIPGRAAEPQYEHRVAGGPWTPYDAEQNSIIAKAHATSPNGVCELPGTPFEVRFGTLAKSSKMASTTTGIMQVNSVSQNSREVRIRPGTDVPTPPADKSVELRLQENAIGRSPSAVVAAEYDVDTKTGRQMIEDGVVPILGNECLHPEWNRTILRHSSSCNSS